MMKTVVCMNKITESILWKIYTYYNFYDNTLWENVCNIFSFCRCFEYSCLCDNEIFHLLSNSFSKCLMGQSSLPLNHTVIAITKISTRNFY